MNSGNKDEKEVLISQDQALEIVSEYIERWPAAMGELLAKRWVKHLTGKPAEPYQKAFDYLILKKEFAFTFDKLRERAGDLTFRDPYKERREFEAQKEAENDN
jgi:hypothetical protein